MKHREELIETIRRLKSQGVRNAEIAAATGLTLKSIEGICVKRGIKRPSAGRLELPLGPRLIEALQREASRRQEPFNRFVRELIRRAVDDKLISAILDDGK